MGFVTFNGTPGETWANDTGRAKYQFLVSWSNSCGACIQYDHAVGNSFPIPLHHSCQCKQVLILPGESSRPFVDYRAKLLSLPASERGRVMGVNNLRLVEAGKVDWRDVVTEGRVRDFREVVSLKKLSVAGMTRAGVGKAQAEEAFKTVHTAAHTLADEARTRLLAALEAKGLTARQASRAVAERLAARVTVGAGPGPTFRIVRTTVHQFPTPLKPVEIEKALGVKLKPLKLVAIGPVPPTLAQQRKAAADAIEKRVAKVTGGRRLTGNEPSDVDAPKKGGGLHKIEVKSKTFGDKQELSVHPGALYDKVSDQLAHPDNVWHTVLIDERNTSEGGAHKDSYSGHDLYYKRAAGRYAIGKMYPVKDEAELLKLMRMSYGDLPEAARGEFPTGEALEKLRTQAATDREKNNARSAERKAKLGSTAYRR